MDRKVTAGHAILLSVSAYIVFAFVPMLAAYVHASDHVAYLDPIRMAALWLGSYLALLVIGWALSLVFFPLTHNPRAVAVPRWDDDAAALPAAAEPLRVLGGTCVNEHEQDELYPPRIGGSDEPRALRVHPVLRPAPDMTIWTFRDCVAARVALVAEEAAWRFGPLDRLTFAESLLRNHVGRTAVKSVLLSMREQPDECDEDEAEVAVREAEAKIAGRGFDCGSCGEDDDDDE